MASNNVYEIIIRYDQDLPDLGDSPIAGAGGAPSAPKGAAGGTSAPASVGAAAGLKAIRPFVDAGMTMRANYVSTVTGAAQLAQRTKLVNSTFSTGLDLATSAASGAGIASALGVAATGPAALVGLAVGGVIKAVEIVTRMAELANKKEVEDTAITAGRARAGISWNMSRRK